MGAAGSVGLVESLPWWEPIVCVCPVILNSSSVVFQKFSQAWRVCLETSTLGLNGIAPHGWGERTASAFRRLSGAFLAPSGALSSVR